MSSGRINKNLWASIWQVVVSGVVLLVVYRFLLSTLGAKEVGLWAIVLTLASAARFAEMGMGSAMIRFVAGHLAKGEIDQAVSAIKTSFVSVAVVVFGFVGLVAPLLAMWIIEPVLDEGQAFPILLFTISLISFWIASMGLVLLGALQGCQRYDLYAVAVSGGHILYLVGTVALVGRMGIDGVAVAHLVQSLGTFFAAAFFLKRVQPQIPLAPIGWSKRQFRAIFSYSYQLQISSIAILLTEPASRILVSRLGGLEPVAYYEMVSRLVQQLRLLLISALRVLIPVYAQLSAVSFKRIGETYERSVRMLTAIALPYYLGIAAALPLVSDLWVGEHNEIFIQLGWLLVAGWGANTFAAPAYFVFVGAGRIGWTTFAHVVIGIGAVAFGYLMGSWWGVPGVVAGLALALILGSSIILLRFGIDFAMSPFQGLGASFLSFGSALILVFAGTAFLWQSERLGESPLLADFLAASIFALASLLVLLVHPRERRLIKEMIPLWKRSYSSTRS